jgi:predicted transcriptional regulator
MAEDSSTEKVNPRLVAEIVSSYVGKTSVAVDQIGPLIATVHHALRSLGANAAASPATEEKLTPAVPVRRSVQPEYVVCLECGFRGKTLRRHLRMHHGLEVGAYRARWKLPSDHPTTAPAYSERRSAMAKELGLGRKTGSVEPSPAPRRRGRRRQPATE